MSFSEYIENHAKARAELPLVHTTEYFRLSSIQANHALRVNHCKIFDEPLLYFFYGRPAYRDPSQTEPTREIGFYPICFVFRPGAIRRARRIFPFDSGASQIGLYEPAINRAEALTAFELAGEVEDARRITDCFFETDEEYLSNEPRKNLCFSGSEEDAASYYLLINGGGDPSCDDRCSAIEVQVGADQDLRKDVMAIVLPNCFLEDDALVSTIVSTWQAVPLAYDSDKGMRPLEFHGTIRHLIRRFYRESRLL